MPFYANEVRVGMIAYFSVNDLVSDARIRARTRFSCPKARPFVCYALSVQTCFWIPLSRSSTSIQGRLRRRYIKVPKNAPTDIYRSRMTLFGPSCTFGGPIAAFAERSHRYDGHSPETRPMLKPRGVEIVQEHILRRSIKLPKPLRMTPEPQTAMKVAA